MARLTTANNAHAVPIKILYLSKNLEKEVLRIAAGMTNFIHAPFTYQ